jgi:hypothetical protein
MDQLREPLPMNFDDDDEFEDEQAMRVLQNEPSEGRPIETINGLNLDTLTVNRRNRLQQYNLDHHQQQMNNPGDNIQPMLSLDHDL